MDWRLGVRRRSWQEGMRRGEENKVEWQIVERSVKYLDSFDDARMLLQDGCHAAVVPEPVGCATFFGNMMSAPVPWQVPL